jgi:hypothetical protein
MGLTDYLDAVRHEIEALTEEGKRDLVRVWVERACRLHLAEWLRAAALVDSEFASIHFRPHTIALRELPSLSATVVAEYRDAVDVARLAVRTNHTLKESARVKAFGHSIEHREHPMEVAFSDVLSTLAVIESPPPLVDIARIAVRMSVVASRCGDVISEPARQRREIEAAAIQCRVK